ncbi:FGGY-family carbohydrate kinase [Pseudolysinimonas kribbensis]|uniref:FGGY-family carbohydrate kinase n=1 Tax=Pseudolysinimonas kribbensis TaxID=433641 RepID=UPI0031DB65A2
MSIVLGIDLATAGARVRAVDAASGHTLGERRAPMAVTGAHGERTQPAVYAGVVRDLVRGVAADLGGRAGEVRALSITGTSGTVVPVDAHGVPVGDAVLYDDPRGAGHLRALAEAGLGARPSAALARAAWMHGAAAGGVARYVFSPDVVIAALAGRLLPSDTSHALKSGIDPVTAAWDAAALAVVGMPRDHLPDLVGPGRVIGEVSRPADWGLPTGVVIVSGMTDGATGQIATGAVREGDTVGVLGTTLVIKAVAPRDVVDAATGVYSHVAPDGLFWPGGASNSGAGVLASGITAGLDPAGHAERIAAVGPSAVVAYPLARIGERFPIADPRFAGFSVSVPGAAAPADDPAARFRTVYEGVAFVERFGLERLAGLGVERRRHHLAGGAAASGVWNRIRATVLARTVIVSEGAGSAAGAAVLAAAALGGETIGVVAERFAGRRSTVDPDEALRDPLEERYHLFCAALGRDGGENPV